MTDTNANASAAPPPPPPPPAYAPAYGAAQPPAVYYAQNPVAARPPGWKSPAVAGVMSMLPGLGHVYLGLYQRAITFFLIWVGLLGLAEHSHGPLPVLIPFWWFFVLIDAVRQAKALNATGAPESNLLVGEKPMKVSGNLTFGVLLILFGLFFFLDRFVHIDLSWLVDQWPILLIAAGGWQVFSYYRGKKDSEQTDSRGDAPAI